MKSHFKSKLIYVLFFCIFFSILVCFALIKGNNGENTNQFKIVNGGTSVLFEKEEMHNGDAKFMGEKIITSIGGQLSIIDINNNHEVMTIPDTNISWLDSVDDENIIVYGNSENKTGIIRLDNNYEVISNDVIFDSENLQIDPTINKIDGKYYVTVTEIAGNVNNSDPMAENGEYCLHLYQSDDLKTWEHLSDIDRKNNNLEDVDFMKIGDRLCAVYEMEQIDKGNSAIIMRLSADGGKSWSEPKELLAANSDHEPVGLYQVDNMFVLCYSSDLEEPGQSYMGGQAYYAVYDNSFNCIEKDIKIETETFSGILWYDYSIIDNEEYFLFAKDYLTTCDMVLEWR